MCREIGGEGEIKSPGEKTGSLSYRSFFLAPIIPIFFLAIPLFSPNAGAEESPLLVASLTPPAAMEREELVRGEERRALNIYTGFRFVSQYVARGLVFSDQPSFQPWIELDIPLIRHGNETTPLDTLTAFAGTWSNVNLSGGDDGRARTGRAAVLKDWYEADVYGGLRVRLSEDLLTSLRYNYYTSPSDSFRDIHELDWRLSYHDAPFWEKVDIRFFPALRVTKEVRDKGGPNNWYIQPSITPTWKVTTWALPVTVQVPLILGFGGNGQYLEPDGDEHHFGFFQTGFQTSVDLDLLPKAYGSLTVSLGVDQVVLADDDLSFQGDGTETVGHTGLTYKF